MVEHFTLFPVIKSEVESEYMCKSNTSDEEHEIREISMAMSVKGIVTEFISIRFIMGIRFIDNQVCVGVRREYVLVTILSK